MKDQTTREQRLEAALRHIIETRDRQLRLPKADDYRQALQATWKEAAFIAEMALKEPAHV